MRGFARSGGFAAEGLDEENQRNTDGSDDREKAEAIHESEEGGGVVKKDEAPFEKGQHYANNVAAMLQMCGKHDRA